MLVASRLVLSALSILAALPAVAGPRYVFDGVAASDARLYFATGGDLWTVPHEGGAATRLTSVEEDDRYPRLSPDGTTLAFSRRSGWDWDVHLLPVEGGEPTRLTFHPKGDIVRGWTPDGTRVLFSSGRHGDNLERLFTVGVDGTDTPEPIGIPRGYSGAFSPDGRRLAYAPIAYEREHGHYRYYRGGRTSALWILDLDDGEVEVVHGPEANHLEHIWRGDELFFTTDVTGTHNLHVRNIQTGHEEALTDLDDFGIRHLALTPDGRTFFWCRAGRIERLDRATGRIREVPITVTWPERPAREPREVPVAEWIDDVAPTPDGRLVLAARGEVLVAGDDGVRSLTGSSGAADRDPVVSPDGTRVAYFSDASGEYQLVVRLLDGSGTPLVLDVEAHPTYYHSPVWSPDGTRLAFSGIGLGLWIADLERERCRRVVRSNYLAQGDYQPAWSPDGGFLAYAKGEPDHSRRVYIHDVERGEHVRVSHDGHASRPVFDPGGRYLYYLASDLAALTAADDIWGLLSSDATMPLVTRTVHAVMLGADTPAPELPFGRGLRDGVDPTATDPAGSIDLDGIAGRVVPLGVPPHDFMELACEAPGVLLLRFMAYPPAPWGDGTILTPLHRYDVGQRGLREVVADVDGFAVHPGGDRVSYVTGGTWITVPTAPDADTPPDTLDLGDATLTVDVAREWEQIYREAWHMMRDLFYDPDHHGQDIAALEAHYREYLPGIRRRWDLTWLLRQALGEVSVSHLSIGGGDQGGPTGRNRTATLGALVEPHQGRYRFTEVFRRGRPGTTNVFIAGAPLDQPGARVEAGEYLLRVNDVEVHADRNVYTYLDDLAYGPITLTVGPNPDGRDARTFQTVLPAGDNSVQRDAFYQAAARRVKERTGGKVAYLYLRSFGSAIQEAVGMLTDQGDAEAILVDQRFGPGGTTSDWFVQLLSHPRLHHYRFRYGHDLTVPLLDTQKPLVVLINEENASASETFPLMVKTSGAGTLVGKRTMGAGVGSGLSQRRLIDGGRIRIPNRAAYDPRAGEWAENRGVAPDIEVEWWPEEFQQGHDPQLDRAIEVALDRIRQDPGMGLRTPPPDRHPR